MTEDVIISKEELPTLPSNFKETRLGWGKKSIKQYRYNRLHIREYGDRYEAHVDKINPETDPIGHLVHDAPEAIAALGAGIAAATVAAAITFNKTKSKKASAAAGASAGISAAYAAKEAFEGIWKKR